MTSPDGPRTEIGDAVASRPRPARSVLVVVNPTAGKTAFHPHRPGAEGIAALLDASGLAYELVVPASVEESVAAVRAAVARGVDLIVAGGGDGTVALVANQLLGCDTALGILPLGSAMNVARALGIPPDLDAAVRLLVEATPQPIDVGEVNGVHFLESAQIGVPAELFGAAAEAEEHDLHAVLRSLARARRTRPVSLQLTIDGRRITTRGMMLAVANAPYTGLLYALAPQERLDDGLLTLLVYRHFSLGELLRYYATVAFARERPHPRVTRWPGRRFTIASDAPLRVRADDADAGTTPAEVRVLPRALRVICGSTVFVGHRRPRGRWRRPLPLSRTELKRLHAPLTVRLAAVGRALADQLTRSPAGALWDPGWIVAVQRRVGPRHVRAAEAASNLGSTWGVIVTLTVAFWIAGRELAYKVLGVVLLCSLATTAIKAVTRLERPSHESIRVWRFEPSDSFPSGHTANAVTVWGGLAAYGRLPWAASLPSVVLVGLSRVYLGVHYVGDVVGGALLGFAMLRLHEVVWPTIRRQAGRLPFAGYVAAGLAAPLVAFPLVRRYPDGWQIVGALIGAGVALPVEHRLLRYAPRPLPATAQVARVGLGLGVLGTLMWRGIRATARRPRDGAPWFAAVALWAVLVGPALFVRLGLARRRPR